MVFITPDASLIMTGTLRDGGSIFLLVTNDNNGGYKFRLMRSISERKKENYNKIEVSGKNIEPFIVDYVEEIKGLRELIEKNKSNIKEAIWNAFNSVCRTPL